MTTGTLCRPLFILGTCLLATSALADDRVVREYTFNISAIEEVELHASVGSMRIVPTSGDEIKLVLEIKASEHGWFNRGKDVEDVELENRVRGKRLILTQDEDDTNTQWTVQLPVVARTTIKMGVGDIDVEAGATELDIDLGVGDVDVVAPANSVGFIDLSVGVGDASLHGAHNVDHDKKFISQDIQGQGNGTLDMDIHLGVGDISVDLD